MNFKRALLCLSLLLLASSAVTPMFAYGNQNGVITVSSTPVQFSSTLGYTSRIAFRVFPGFCGKMYIGTSTMNTSTLAGVMKVLYPNCSGGLSDEYVVTDPTANDSINSAIFYIAGDISGEKLAWESLAYGSGAAPLAVKVMNPLVTGPFRVTGVYPVLLYGGVQFDLLQVNIVPGQTGKFRIFGPPNNPNAQPDATYANTRKVLYPNNGTVTGTITDKYESGGPSSAYRDGTEFYSGWPEVAGEFPLVTVWSRQ